jgi:predicted double-glycine peptidase
MLMGCEWRSVFWQVARFALVAGLLPLASAPTAGQVVVHPSGAPYSLQVMSYRDIPFRTTVRQRYDYSCGSAAVATLLRFHYGRNVGEAEIFQSMYLEGEQARIRTVGFSLLDMKRYLERNGFRSDGFRMTLDEIEKNRVPAITLLTIGTYKHFVVIKGAQNGRILVGDPALGLKSYPRQDFEKMWNGIAFLIRDPLPADKIAFNRSEEWSPWARAPSGERLDAHSLFGINANLPTIYQIQQLTLMQPLTQ